MLVELDVFVNAMTRNWTDNLAIKSAANYKLFGPRLGRHLTTKLTAQILGSGRYFSRRQVQEKARERQYIAPYWQLYPLRQISSTS